MYILNRPLAIVILVGLNAAVGAIVFMNGLSTGGLDLPTQLSFGSEPSSIINTAMSIIGAFELPIGAAFFGSAAGLFLGKSWGWTLSRVLQIVGVVFGFGFMYDAGGQYGIMGLYTLSMVMCGIGVGFLYTPEVKEFYGKFVAPPVRRQRRKKAEISEEQESSATEVE